MVFRALAQIGESLTARLDGCVVLGAHPPDGRFHFLGVDVVRAGFQLSTSASMR
jgi:hypothetical protein